jgi:threonine aldolase
VGSLLLGKADFIKEAKRVRKKFGGGWRQAGFLAAAGIYALDHHVKRLAEDHDKAKTLASTLESLPWVNKVVQPETNILIFHVDNGDEIIEKLAQKEISIIAMAPNMLRIVTHLDFDYNQMERTVEILRAL